jgi:hypothetical protein
MPNDGGLEFMREFYRKEIRIWKFFRFLWVFLTCWSLYLVFSTIRSSDLSRSWPVLLFDVALFVYNAYNMRKNEIRIQRIQHALEKLEED